MKNRFKPGALAILAAFSVAAGAQAAGNAASGKIKSETCLGCHGIARYENVYPTYQVPKIAGQHADYIIAALKGYASGKRSHLTMQAQASSMSEQDMQDIAAYLATLAP